MSLHLIKDHKNKKNIDTLMESFNKIYEIGGWEAVYDTLAESIRDIHIQEHRRGWRKGWNEGSIATAVIIAILGAFYYFFLK